MTASPAAPYTLKRVQETLGLSRAVVAGLIGAGFVTPQRGPRNEHRFTFQDLLLLRTAFSLQQAQVTPRKIVSALARLRTTLPSEMPLTGLRISAIGANVVVRDRQGPWDADSGQWLMDFEVAAEGGTLAFISPAPAPAPAPDPARAGDDGAAAAETWFQRGEGAEAADPAAAATAYRRALACDPAHLNATLNLGAMLCERGDGAAAVVVFEAALQHGVDDALLHFNLGVAFEDSGQPAAALASYANALRLDPGLADAHYNAGRLHELHGDARHALRHFSAYKRLQRGKRS